MTQLIFSLILFVGLFVFLIRPQMQKAKMHRLFMQNLKVKQQVVVNESIMGEIIAIQPQYVIIQVGKNTYVTVLKSALSYALPANTLKFHA